jgi:inorganic triphosphatase YgiF
MAIETELKLRIAPEHLEILKRHPFLRSISCGRAISRKLYSIYYDTPGLELSHQKMALRLRRVGNQWLQTLKGGGGVQAGLHQRNEWETPVAGEKLDFDALEKVGATHLSGPLRKKVEPRFITDFTRSIRLVKFEGATVEIGLDSGEIRSGKSKHPISELELELKSGDPLQLFRLALALLDIVPLEIETTSKAEYGYRLKSPIKPIVNKATILNINDETPIKDALQSMIWSCLFHLQANVPGAISNTKDEYLHQVRVALRRLRVVLDMTSKLCVDKELDSLSKHVADIGNELGRSREWDVFVTAILPSIFKDGDAYACQRALARESEMRRQLSHQLVGSILSTDDFQRTLLRFGAWMHGAYWKTFSNSESLFHNSEIILQGYVLKTLQRGQSVQENENNEQLHKLRIACKNLRYSSELFTSMSGIKTKTNQAKTLVKLQDILGKLNDNTVALRLLDELGQSAKVKNINMIRKEIVNNYSKHLKRFRKIWKKFRVSIDEEPLKT